MNEQLLSFAGRVRRRRLLRRLVGVLLAGALAGGMLAAVPAQAARGGSLVQIVSPANWADTHASTVPVTIQLRPGARPPSLKVLLDFRDVTARFHRHGHTVQGVLTGKDGLIDGNNVLTARVTGPAGGRSAAQVIFGARGLLQDEQPMPLTFPLQTRVVTQSPAEPGDHFEVLVGAVAHQAPPLTASCGNGVWVLVLGRKSLDEDRSVPGGPSVDKPLCSTGDAKALGAYLAGLPGSDMVIVNSLSHADGQPAVPGLGDALAKIGVVKAEFNGLGKGVSYSVWGIPGLSPGQAYQGSGAWASEQQAPAGHATAASINTTLVPDNNGNYTPDMRDYVTFSAGGGQDLASQGNITVGGRTYPPDPSAVNRLEFWLNYRGVVGGFHVVVLDRRTLDVLSDKTYLTATAGGQEQIDGQVAMARDLTAAHNLGESALVIVASLGNPMADGQLQGITAPTVAQALAPFGGTPDVLNSGASHPGDRNWPYALVGAVSPPEAYGLSPVEAPEASPAIHDGATGELDGALQRGTRGMWYGPAGWNAPYTFDINGQPQPPTTENYGMYRVLAQAPTPWPVPAPGDAGEVAAYHYLSHLACTGCGDDIRRYYWVEKETIMQYQTVIWGAEYSNVPDDQKVFTEAQFDAVQKELACPGDQKSGCGPPGELKDVEEVDGLHDLMDAMINDVSQLKTGDLDKAYNSVKDQVKPPDTELQFALISSMLEITEALAGIDHATEFIEKALAVVTAAFKSANELTNATSGDPEDQLKTTVAGLQDKAPADFLATKAGLKNTFAEIFSDWGRLSTVADGVINHPDLWDPTGGEPALVTAMNNAMTVAYYKALIPVVYAADEGFTRSPDPAKWCVIVDPLDTTCPFIPEYGYEQGTSAYSYPVNNPENNWSPAYDLTVVGQKPITNATGHRAEAFTAPLMKDLTDAGYYPGWFFLRFPLYRSVCAPSQKFQQPDACKPDPALG